MSSRRRYVLSRVAGLTAQHLPLAVAVSFAFTARSLPRAVVLFTLFVGLALLVVAAEHVRVRLADRAGVDVLAPMNQRVDMRVARYRSLLRVSMATWLIGFWAAPAGVLAEAYASYWVSRLVWRKRLRALAPVPVAVGDLPPQSRDVLESVPGVRVYRIRDGGRTVGGAAYGTDTVWVTDATLAGDPEELTAVIAHEVAHLMRKRRHATWSKLRPYLMTATTGFVPAWMFAVAIGAMPARLGYPSPHPRFAPSLAGLVGGAMLLDLASQQVGRWRSRREEWRVDRDALERFDIAAGFIRWLGSHQSGLEEWEPGWLRALEARHPRTRDRIRLAEQFLTLPGAVAPSIGEQPRPRAALEPDTGEPAQAPA